MTSKVSIVIYSPKTGEMLCKIFSPSDTDWTSANDEKVIQWAWQQAYLIKYSWNALQIVAKDFANRTVGPKFKMSEMQSTYYENNKTIPSYILLVKVFGIRL
jgi:hypothetical protein